ncbi:MAG: winged helix-turn-helix domain-containing protein [Actinomycetota bacterium]|nr:winged helix-turn-helix domain-containing protein [Actinomycetota bacterium]
MLRFHALGGLAITDDGGEVSMGGPRQRRLVAMLLIHRNAVVSVDRLADAVFAGEPTSAASTTLRSYVARIRRVVDRVGSTPMVVTQAPGYVLRLPDEAFDVACFECLLADAGSRLGRDDAAGASSVLHEALALWRGDAYAEFAYEDWARPEAQRLEELRLVAHERLVEAELACGRAAEMVPVIESLAGEHELREVFRAQLMTALYRAGRQADSLRVFRDYRRVLVEELGLEPSPALAELERRVLTHDPTLLLTEPAGRPLRGYRLGERLGTGRDGTLFSAHLPGVERDLVVRIFREEIANCPEFVRSFEAHAHRIASLHHPAVVAIHDYWREPGAAYLVMRRMHGGTLADRLGRGPLTASAAATLVGRVGGALAAAADAGIVHGRVTPDSVLFDTAGDPYLADFALGPTAPTQTASDDVHDLAVMVAGCLSIDRGPVGDVLARGVATADRPSMAQFVPMLVAALTGAAPSAEEALPNPYKGLRAFDETDAADFFGRADLVDEILARLGRDDLQGRLVLVVGGSGTGKSSVVQAGLLPQVRRGDVAGSRQWFVTTMLPGSSPFKELAESLRRVAITETTGLAEQLVDEGGIDQVLRRLVPADSQLLLVVDQFEELFTLATEHDQRAFLDGVMHAVSAPDSRLRVVATLRADFYDRPLAVHRFGAAVSEATVTIAAMAPAELEAAVVEPVERVGGRVERALVAELVNAVVDEPAALPSLQFTLYELADRSAGRTLTLAAYRELGGVDGAIASRAELLYSTLDDVERAAVRRMFERLVVVGAEVEPTRRRAARTELSGLSADLSMDAAIDRWAQARLLTLDRHPQTRVPTVELAHEALLRKWPRLGDWVAADREVIVTLGHLREATAGWVELGRDPGALYRGTRLGVALDAIEGRADALPEREREFLDASRQERDREQRQEAERVSRQARANRRLRFQLAAIAVALVVALVGGFVALDQRSDAERERRVATARGLAAAADANLDDDPERSVLLALAAIDETRSSDGTVLPEAEEALHRAVTASRIQLSVPGVGGGLDWSPDGTVFVTEGPENSGLIDIRDAETGVSVRSFQGHDVDVNVVAFSGDGSMLATTGDDGAARVWDPTTGDELFEFTAEEGGTVVGPSFSPDGSRLAASWLDQGIVRVIDLATEEVIAEIESPEPWGTAFSPDGERLAFGTFSEPIAAVVDADTGEELFTLDGHEDTVRGVGWSPDARWIATTSSDGTARIWDADSGEPRFTMAGHIAPVVALDWSPDSTRLATASDDGTARISEIVAGGIRELFSFSAQDTNGGLNGVAFSPDGERLMTGDNAITAVKIWDASTTGGAEWANVPDVFWIGVDLTPDGRGLVATRANGTASMTDIETGDRLATFSGHSSDDGGFARLDLSDDGRLLATGIGHGVDVWDRSTGDHRFAFSLDTDEYVAGLEWTRKAELLAIVVENLDDDRFGQVVVVDRSGAEVARLREESGQAITSVSFSPDGRLLATTREGIERIDPENMPVTIWDWERGAVVSTIDTSASLVVFDPTGTRIATSRRVEGIADVWNAQTGERVATLTSVSPIGDIRFGPEGTSVATGHTDGTVRLWDPDTGVQQLTLDASRTPIRAVRFSTDGSRLATVDYHGLARVWALDLDDLIAIATDRLTRALSDDECRQYLHLERCPQP